jgi:hypothetical protein
MFSWKRQYYSNFNKMFDISTFRMRRLLCYFYNFIQCLGISLGFWSKTLSEGSNPENGITEYRAI